jgi:HEAT repeat protein
MRDWLHAAKWDIIGAAVPSVDAALRALSDKKPTIRIIAIELLADSAPRRAVRLIAQVLANDAESGVRMVAAQNLSKFEPNAREQVVAALLSSLSDGDAGVRGQSARSLGEIQAPEAIDQLIVLLRDRRWSVRFRAAEALIKFDDPRVLPALLQTRRRSVAPWQRRVLKNQIRAIASNQ